jgi:hypothetical protein
MVMQINWDNPGNWDCGTVPGVNSIVIIPEAGPGILQFLPIL